jgi:Zn-dependent metalloprotease
VTAARACRCCWFVPPALLRRLAAGNHVAANAPHIFADTLAATSELRSGRSARDEPALDGLAAVPAHPVVPPELLARSPVHLFDCAATSNLPGTPLATEQDGGAASASVAATTAKVRDFYRDILGRDSIDGLGMAIVSSLNYGQQFQNAFWSGQMMVYGNGDQNVFDEFWKAPDVICHEITHGVTQFASGLVYAGEAGAVNESISDSFAATFRQWLNQWPAANPAGWLVGGGILGPAALAHGYTCLRDMLGPTAAHCLTPQPSLYPNRDTDGDVHLNSGIPNRAFALFARAAGGNAHAAPIKLWYAACTAQGLTANATIGDFAAATIRAAAAWTGPERDALLTAARTAWTTVQVPMPA